MDRNAELIDAHKSGATKAQLARRYGISPTRVHAIVRNAARPKYEGMSCRLDNCIRNKMGIHGRELGIADLLDFARAGYLDASVTEVHNFGRRTAREARDLLVAAGYHEFEPVAKVVKPPRRTQQATIDALVAALEAVAKGVPDVLRRECLNEIVEDALALARGEPK